MPEFVVDRLVEELNEHGLPVKGTKILIVGVAYKPEIDDLRESPALEIIEFLNQRGSKVFYVDPFVPKLEYEGMSFVSQSLDVDPSSFDAAIIVTHHKGYDYAKLVQSCPLVMDTRNITRNLTPGEGVKIVRL
jgi:UDP-N-acetyl-D-glucosamine dehydrogenase